MRLVEFTQKTLKEILAEIDRRGFLKGLGAVAASATVPSIAKAANDKIRSYLEKMVNDDPLILLYLIDGNTVTLYINGPRIEKGYKANLEVNKKLRARGKDVKDPKDALEYSGFNDLNKKSIKSKIGLDVEYRLINTQEELMDVHNKKRRLEQVNKVTKDKQSEPEQSRASSRASDPAENERIKLSQIRDKVKREWAWAGDKSGLEVTFGIKLSPRGDIQELKVLKSSGDSSFDVSVKQAIMLAKPLPVPKDETLAIKFSSDYLRN